MLKVCWDKEINGIILLDTINDNDEITPPRPVFYEELNLLGFNTRVNYPNSAAPILWAIERRYYYAGQLVAEVRGGSIYSDPVVSFSDDFELEYLHEIDIDLVIKKNMKSINTIENEAMDFVQDMYVKYKAKVDGFVVAFSAGKDSQVILDVVSRTIPPNEYKVVFTDTGMELPVTYQTFNQTQNIYRKKFNGFEMVKAESNKNAISLWEKFGPPSRINRWCCSVLKTSLFGRKMREQLLVKKQPKLVVFEGVRADESHKRETYNRIGEGVKHINLINSRAIFKWNTTEIFMYIFYRKINLNPAYRSGFTRVGCSVCPFASDWSEFLMRKLYSDLTLSYVKVIEKMAKKIGISSKVKINQYIESGNWKKNVGGKGLKLDQSRIDILTREPNFEAVISFPKTDLFSWLKAVGKFIISSAEEGNYLGELNYDDEIYKFETQSNDLKTIFKVYNTSNKIFLISALNKMINKTAYCEKCGVCEMECSTGALKIIPSHFIETSECVNCKNCLNINSVGCIIAERRKFTEGATKVSLKSSSIDKYSTFGLREKWLLNFFEQMDNWFLNNNLGTKQVPAMISWLRESELLETKNKRTTELAKVLKDIIYKDSSIVWQIIWVNLSFNSTIVRWYVENIKNNVVYSKPEMLLQLKEVFPKFTEGTLDNPLSALYNAFEKSPLGSRLKLGLVHKKGSIRSVTKTGGDFISPTAVAYLLYKIAKEKNSYELSVSDFYGKGETGPYEVFGISRGYFLNCLRSLQEQDKGIVKVDLLGGLDNIHLCEEYDELTIAKMLM